MSWRNVRLVLQREVRDQLRDRRTLFMIAVLPVLLYPAMGIGMVQLQMVFAEQPRTVVVLGADHLPKQDTFPLIEDGRFVAKWFQPQRDAKKLQVVTDSPRSTDDGETVAKRNQLLAEARQIRRELAERDELQDRLEELRQASDDAEPDDDTWIEVDRLERELKVARRSVEQLFAESPIDVLIVVPEGLAENVEAVDRMIAEREDLDPDSVDALPRPRVIRNSADEKSIIAYGRVKDALRRWEDQVLAERLEKAHLPPSITKPFNADSVDVAGEEALSANVWSKMFPALLVIMSVTGAFYPAIDLAAGEKERGTMETLLISPAQRSEIVIGKFLTVMLFSIGTALLNLTSMGLTGKYMISFSASSAMARFGNLNFPGLGPILWVVVLSIPLAALFSALSLALATFARSSKEGQHYLTPLLMVTLGLTVFCLSPGVEIRPMFAVMPVVGPALLLKELLAAPSSAGPLIYAIPVLVTSIGYSALALWWAIDQFSREDVLFRAAERFDVRLWVHHLLRDKEPTPSFAEAGFCFVLIMFLQFGMMRFFQASLAGLEPGSAAYGLAMIKLLMIQQLVIIATPALIMGVMLTTSVRETFRIRLPDWRMLAAAVALPVVLHPLVIELAVVMQKHFFQPLPEHVTEQLQLMSSSSQPLWLVLLAFALMPGFCEEIAFRGFVLSGFAERNRTWLAIGLSALTFGIMHLIPQQVFNATLLGLVLGLLAVRSRSLLPGIVFHVLNNGLSVMRERYGVQIANETPISWFTFVGEGGLRYHWATLVMCSVAAIMILHWLVRFGRDQQAGQPSGPVSMPSEAVTADVAETRTVGVN